MTRTLESLTDNLLTKMGASSLSQVANIFPSAHTTDVYTSAAKRELEAGRVDDAFHQLSLSHSTLIHHRMAQRLHKPCRSSRNVEAGDAVVTLDTLEAEKEMLAASDKTETLALLQQLPSEWTVVQITAQHSAKNAFRQMGTPSHTPGLYISRCSCGTRPTIAIQAVSAPKDKGVRGILQEVNLIKEESKIINKEYSKERDKYLTRKEELNNRLKCVVRSMEVAWLRHWICMLSGSLDARHQQLLRVTTDRILTHHKPPLTDHQRLLLQCWIICPMSSEKSGRADFTLRSGVAAVLGESVRSQRVKDLSTAIQEEEEVLEQLWRAERNPVILVLDKSIVSLPWEMTWILSDQPVTRMPSLRMLALLYQHHSSRNSSILVRGVDFRKGFYLLDPESNLLRTQERLKPLFSGTGWPGIIARRPSHKEFKDAISTKDLFVYAGHGSGSQYLPGELVEESDCRALVLLYGCSSVRLAPRGRIPDPWGVVLNYLVAYCPCVVGMLWEVTDKDTDLVTLGMIQALQGTEGEPGTPLATPPTDIALLVARSRSLCRSYTTAAALIVYGLPLHIINTTGD